LKYYYAQQTAELMYIIKLLENPAILDVGCGCGTESLWMAYNDSTVKGIDVREDRLAVARKRKSIIEQRLDREITCTFENRSLLDLSKSNKFDIIWMGQTFHHLEPRNNVFDKLAELIKKNGYIIISESNAWNPAMQFRQGAQATGWSCDNHSQSIESSNGRSIEGFGKEAVFRQI